MRLGVEEDPCRMMPIDLTDLTVEYLGKTVSIQHSDAHKGFLRGRLVEIRHRPAADGGPPETRVKVHLFEDEPGVVVAVTLGPDRLLQR
jgi:hypothetical protein